MSVMKQVAYLKGLTDGLDLDPSTKEGKVFAAILNCLEAIADELALMREDLDILDDLTDGLDEDLGRVQEYLLEGLELDEEELDDFYTEACPHCGAILTLEDEDLIAGVVCCPACNEQFNIEEEDASGDEGGGPGADKD